MRKVVVDLETVSLADIKKLGSLNYAKHPSTNISVMCWKDTESDKTHTLSNPLLSSRPNKQEDINALGLILGKSKLIAHNAPFELDILNNCLEKFLSDCNIRHPKVEEYKLSDFIDTMVLSMMHRSPAALKKALKFFNLEELKDELGSKVMKIVCKLKEDHKETKTSVAKIKGYWVNFKDNLWAKGGPDVYEVMIDYCQQDVLATDGLFKYLASHKVMKNLGGFSKHAIAGMKTTEQINMNGIGIDIEGAKRLVHYKNIIEEKLDASTLKHFGVDSGAKRAAILRAINELTGRTTTKTVEDGYEQIPCEDENGIFYTEEIPKYKDVIEVNEGIPELTSLSPDKIIDYMKNCTNKKVIQGLKDRLKYNKTSLKKAEKALLSSYEGRLYNLLKYCGANATGRWSSFGVQLQNIPRPDKNVSYENAIDVLKGKYSDEEILENPDLAVSAIRAMFLSKEGYKFFISDLSQIELRWVLHKCGYEKESASMADGADLYLDFARQLFNEDVDKDSEERYIAKQAMLAAQYGVGAKGFIKQLAKNSPLRLSEKEAQRYVTEYRKRYPKVKKQWDRYGKLLKIAAESGKPFRVKLCTGRYLDYGKIIKRMIKDKFTGEIKEALMYFNGVSYNSVYGSMVFQHMIQAECGDLMKLKINDMQNLSLIHI